MDSKRSSRRELLKAGAALAGGITLGTGGKAEAQHDHPMTPGSENASPMIHGSKEQIEYGQRSKYVTSVRVQHPIGGRPSPDVFGKVFHVATPLQDSIGVITPSSLHYIATTRGSFLPDIDPRQHTLTIHGLVDRPLTLTMDELKRLPSVTRLHFIECAGNRHTAAAWPWVLRDQRTGLVRRRCRQDRGGIHRRREEVEPRRVQEHAAAHGARPIRLSMEVGWNRDRDYVALHR